MVEARLEKSKELKAVGDYWKDVSVTFISNTKRER